MHKGRITQDSHRLSFALLTQGFVEAMDGTDGSAHAFAGLNGVKGFIGRQGVAADVAQNGDFVLGQGVEQASVGTSGAEHRGTAGNGLVQRDPWLLHVLELLRHHALGELPHQGHLILADDLQAKGAAVVLDDGVQFFQDDDLIHLGGKVQDLLPGQGIHQAQLQDGGFLPKDLSGVLVAGGGGDDAQGDVLSHLLPVQIGGLREGDKLPGPLLHDGVAGTGVAGDHDVLGNVLHIGTGRGLLPLSGLHDALGVGDAGAELQEHGGIVFLGQLVGDLSKAVGLLGIRRLQHGQFGGDGIPAGVLLVLRGVHARVVCHADDHARVDAGVRNGEQRIGRHIHAHVLHNASRSLACQGCAEGHLHGDLFVGRPFAVDLRILGSLLGDLGAGRARIAGNQAAASLIQTAGCCCISQHQFLHGPCPLSGISVENPMFSTEN